MAQWIIWVILKLRGKFLLVEPVTNQSSDTEWIVKFSNNGKQETRIFQGENAEIVKKRFLSVRPNAQINNIVCLN